MAEQEIMLGEWAAEWFRTHAEGKLARNTKGGYRNLIFKHIIPRLGGVALADLSEKRIKSFYRMLARSGLSDRSVWCVHLLLRRILDEACREGLISENPARAFQYPTVRQVKAETLTDQEIEDYLDAARELGYLPIFLLVLEQGLRQRELIALKWSDLDVKNRTLTIYEKRTVECGKLAEHGDRLRTICLPKFTVECLVHEHEKHPSNEVMFIHPVSAGA